MKKIELILSGTYLCQGKVYEKNHTYGVEDAVADYLLQQRNERDVPYFRLSENSPAVAPPKKPTHKGGVLEVVDESTLEAEAEADSAPSRQKRTRKVEPPSTSEDAVTV